MKEAGRMETEKKETDMQQRGIRLLKRVLVYCGGLFIMALGVSFSGAADLGMSPVNSIPYVLSEIFTALSMGTWIIIIFSLYILIQFIILGRDVQPASTLCGWSISLSAWPLSPWASCSIWPPG